MCIAYIDKYSKDAPENRSVSDENYEDARGHENISVSNSSHTHGGDSNYMKLHDNVYSRVC